MTDFTSDAELERIIREAVKEFKETPGGEEGKVIIFNKAQAEALVEVAQWWVALRGVTMFGGVIASTVKWAAVVIGGWIAIKSGLLTWIANNIGGQS